MVLAGLDQLGDVEPVHGGDNSVDELCTEGSIQHPCCHKAWQVLAEIYHHCGPLVVLNCGQLESKSWSGQHTFPKQPIKYSSDSCNCHADIGCTISCWRMPDTYKGRGERRPMNDGKEGRDVLCFWVRFPRWYHVQIQTWTALQVDILPFSQVVYWHSTRVKFSASQRQQHRSTTSGKRSQSCSTPLQAIVTHVPTVHDSTLFTHTASVEYWACTNQGLDKYIYSIKVGLPLAVTGINFYYQSHLSVNVWPCSKNRPVLSVYLWGWPSREKTLFSYQSDTSTLCLSSKCLQLCLTFFTLSTPSFLAGFHSGISSTYFSPFVVLGHLFSASSSNNQMRGNETRLDGRTTFRRL